MTTELTIKTDLNTILANIPSTVDSECKEIIIASEKQKIKDMENKDVVLQMKDILVRTIFEAGHKFEEQDQTSLLMIVCDDLLRDFPFLTIDEIKIIYRKGVRKLYGEYYGLTVISLYNWVTKYIAETRDDAMRIKREAFAVAQASKYETPPPPKDEWQKIMYNSSIELFDRYKQKNDKEIDLLDIGNIHYNFLTGLGLISFSDERKEKINKMAEAKLRIAKKPLLASERMDSINFLKALENKEQTAMKAVENEAKRISLFEYFNDLIEIGIDIKSTLDDKLKQ